MISGNHSTWIKKRALELGFSFCGIAKAEKLVHDEARLNNWLNKNYHGEMTYMANHFEKRLDPRLLVDGAKSVITFLLNYYPSHELSFNGFKISKYAYGNDYHEVIRSKLNTLQGELENRIGPIQARGFVDSAPVLERSWAVKSGLGWVGRNGNLIHKHHGSFLFIATLIVDTELDYDIPFVTDHCGTCTKCVDSCPTEAILPNKEINGSQCISYYTIELKKEVIESNYNWKDWIFGCDICQDVCPWNRFSKPTREESFQPSEMLKSIKLEDLENQTQEAFHKVFKNSAIKRTKLQGLRRNIKFVKG